MDRRTFLKSLLAVDAISRMPIDLAIASDAEVDAVFEEFQDIWGLFVVDNHGTVYSANFEEPCTRRDAYGLGRAETLDIDEIEDNPALAEVTKSHYLRKLEEHRDWEEEQREMKAIQRNWEDEEDEEENDETDLDAKAEEEWMDWAKNCTPAERKALNVELDEALDSEPDWIFEGDVLYESASAQGAAYQYFLGEDVDLLRRLGIVIVEGEFPGSSYFAAELRRPLEEVNEIAARQGWSIRFIREGAA